MKLKLIFVVGPTATGKTRFAIDSAQQNNGEIVNCDSVQIFKALNIGSAKPSNLELDQVKHHLLSVIEKGSTCTAGDYRRLAINVIDEVKARSLSNLYFVGGSGFYFQALEKGMFDVGKIPESIHSEIQKQGATDSGIKLLFEELERADPKTAKKIGPNDTYRIQRAVELLRTFKKPPSALRENFRPQSLNVPIIKVGLSLNRDRLREIVILRTKQMFKMGLINEVEQLLNEGLGAWQPMSSVGYKEIIAYLKGEISIEEAESLIVQSTMQLAKRQMTWFKRDKEIKWFDSEREFKEALMWVNNQIQNIDAST